MTFDRAATPVAFAALASTALSVLAFGGTPSWVVFVSGVVLIGALATVVTGDGELVAPLPVGLAIAMGLLGLAQILPLPHALLGLLSPEAVGLRAFTLGTEWSPLSYAPGETALAVARSALIGGALLAGARLAREDHLEVPVRVVLLVGAAVFAVILGHAVMGLEAIYGVKEAVGRGFSAPLGPFVNANHLAAFLVLLVPVAAGAAWATSSSVERAAAVTLSLAAAAALVATFSRGGMVALLAATVVFAIGARRVTEDLRVLAVPLGAGLAAVSAGVAWTGGHVLFLFNRDLFLAPRGKGPIWEAGLAMLADHRIGGIGRGGFGAIYPRYGLPDGAVASAHVENSYLAMLLDFGLPLGLLLLGGVVLVARSALRSRPDPLRVGVWAGLGGLAVHNLVDYNVELPGIAVPAALLLGAVCATPERERGDAPEHPLLNGVTFDGTRRGGLLLGTLATLLTFGSLLGYGGSVEAADARREALLSEEPLTPSIEAAAAALAAERPTDPWSWLPLGRAVAVERPQDALKYINRAMVLDPRSPEPHKSAAWALLRVDRRAQAAGEARRALEKTDVDAFDPLLELALQTWSREGEWRRILPQEADSAERAVAWFRRADQPERALEAARAWVAAEDAGPRANVILAELLSDVRGRAEDREARLLLEEALDRTAGWELDRALLIYGRVQLRRGEAGWAELAARLERIPRAADPRVSARASYLEGRLAQAGGRMDEALTHARRAVELLPEAPEYRGELARVERLAESSP